MEWAIIKVLRTSPASLSVVSTGNKTMIDEMLPKDRGMFLKKRVLCAGSLIGTWASRLILMIRIACFRRISTRPRPCNCEGVLPRYTTINDAKWLRMRSVDPRGDSTYIRIDSQGISWVCSLSAMRRFCQLLPCFRKKSLFLQVDKNRLMNTHPSCSQTSCAPRQACAPFQHAPGAVTRAPGADWPTPSTRLPEQSHRWICSHPR